MSEPLVDISGLREWMGETFLDHEQAPPASRRGCAAHNEGLYCCLDYFYDTIAFLLDRADADD